MSNHKRKQRGQYIPKEQIAYWAPISHDDAEIIRMAIQHYKRNEMKFAPFQMLSKMIREFRPHDSET